MKIQLNIRNLSAYSDEELSQIIAEVGALHDKTKFSSPFYEPLVELRRKAQMILNKRGTSKMVILEFSVQWSGYGGQSSPRRSLGVEYRKVKREAAAKIGSFFSHRFSDNTSNDWHIKTVAKMGKNKSGGYGGQVDEYLKSLTA